MTQVAVIGAGITGLAAAWELENAGAQPLVLESERRTGGVIVTERRDGFVVEGGPDGFLAAERRNMEQVAKFLKKNEVTVCAVGVDFSRARVEAHLRKVGGFENDEALLARARAIHEHRLASWRAAFEQARGTLFVVAAGDDNQDVSEYETLPASIEAPNVIARAQGSTAASGLPYDVDLVLSPSGVVGPA